MANEVNDVLKGVIRTVQKYQQFEQGGMRRDMVRVTYQTPSGFQGTMIMSWEDWKDGQKRAELIFAEIEALEGPFWASSEE